MNSTRRIGNEKGEVKMAINFDDLVGKYITVKDKHAQEDSELPVQLRSQKSKLCGSVLQVVSMNLPYVLVKLLWHETTGFYKPDTEMYMSLDANELNFIHLSDDYVEAVKKDNRGSKLPIE